MLYTLLILLFDTFSSFGANLNVGHGKKSSLVKDLSICLIKYSSQIRQNILINVVRNILESTMRDW